MRLFASVILSACIFVVSGIANTQTTKNAYPLTVEAGTWLICCGSYSGIDAPELSKQLTEILKTRDNLTAYIFNYGEEEKKKQIADFERRQKMSPELRQPMKFTRVSEQCAVLLGGHKDIEDARKNL